MAILSLQAASRSQGPQKPWAGGSQGAISVKVAAVGLLPGLQSHFARIGPTITSKAHAVLPEM